MSEIRNRFWIFALGLSRPGTMGGNSKIALEVARHIPSFGFDVHFIVPSDKVKTVENALGNELPFTLHVVDAFPGDDKLCPIASVRHFIDRVRTLFRTENVGPGDVVWGISEFHVDVLPLFRLKREFGFRWIASFFLFVPFVFENICRRYGFPVFKYIVYWFYERTLFMLARWRADAFVVTNDTDRANFPKSFQDNVFAFYGGVNVEQISGDEISKVRDVVFCSRLHPQKGISGLLDIWKLVLAKQPEAKLSVIGNGDPAYERKLKDKAARLGLGESVEWLGYVNGEEKYRIYRSARIFVHPTVFDNNGMVAAEALCSGLPVVMYDLPPLRKVYTDGCVKVPFGDKRAFAAEVVSLLYNPDVAAPDEGRIVGLRAQWDWVNRVRCFEAFLQDVMA